MSIPFPTTHATWLGEHLRTAPDEVRTHVMERYFEPLCVYARASSLRLRGEPAELVGAFFAARLADPAYLERWTSSGLPLRRWLANGLLLHARNASLAARRRAEQDLASTDELARVAALRAIDHETNALLALERAWAVRTVTEAHERVRLELDREGRGDWWELFRLHSLHDMPYAKACEIARIAPTNATNVHRAVTTRLREALRAILLRDGVAADAIDAELAGMQELLER
jgi:hypothetical protein